MALPTALNDRQLSALNREVNTGTASFGMTLDSDIAGEDRTVGVLKVEQRFTYNFQTAVGTTTIKGSTGFIHGILVGSTSAGGALTVYDSASGTNATIVAQLKASIAEGFYPIDVTTTNGIVVVNLGTQIYTASYR